MQKHRDVKLVRSILSGLVGYLCAVCAVRACLFKLLAQVCPPARRIKYAFYALLFLSRFSQGVSPSTQHREKDRRERQPSNLPIRSNCTCFCNKNVIYLKASCRLDAASTRPVDLLSTFFQSKVLAYIWVLVGWRLQAPGTFGRLHIFPTKTLAFFFWFLLAATVKKGKVLFLTF